VTNLVTIRCSSLPIAFKCPGAVRPAEVLINPTSDAAEMGTAAHEVLAAMVLTGSVDWDLVGEISRVNGVDRAELGMLVANGAKLWEQVKGSFPEPDVEVELEHGKLTGHADIIGHSPHAVHVGDWKTGHKDGDYSHQLRGYALLALAADPDAKSATASVLWVRDGEVEHYEMTRAEAADWERRLHGSVINWDGTYRPGSHCAHCPRNHECPAVNAMVRRDVAWIANLDVTEALARRTPQEKVALLEVADHVAKVAARVRDALKSEVLTGGDIVGEEKYLTIVSEERRMVDTLAAFPVLEAAEFDDKDFAACITISGSKAKDVVAKRAGRGKGAAAVRELDAALDAAGAYTTTTIEKLTIKRVT